MKFLIILVIILILFLSGCVDQTKEIIRDVKSTIGSSQLGKHCDIKNKIVCYETSGESSNFHCVQVEKPICKQEEILK
jgi:PBP1b-binding outer membrane lipoprotein LpoB